jgi:hypothetical protein
LIAVLVAIPIAEAAMVPAEGPVLPAAALVPVARLVASVLPRRLGLMRLRLARLWLKRLVEHVLALVVAELVADVAGLAHARPLPFAISPGCCGCSR